MLRRLAVTAAVCGLLSAPVFAQDEMPTFAGMAVAQAPEAGLGVCFGVDAAETMGCAQYECMEQSGLGEADCAVNLWCYPHWWAAQIAVLHTEGIHWSKFICDANTREHLEAEVALYCDDEMFAECGAVRIWDPDGTAVLDFE
jgi:hypothetical protein